MACYIAVRIGHESDRGGITHIFTVQHHSYATTVLRVCLPTYRNLREFIVSQHNII